MKLGQLTAEPTFGRREKVRDRKVERVEPTVTGSETKAQA
jgi:hypothetical protein